jgi:phosphoenolpyruvate synthase/pyruvate phosphate dikinase
MQPSTQPHDDRPGGDGVIVRPLADAGFEIGTSAYARLCDAGTLRQRLADALRGVGAADRGRLIGAALQARGLVGAEPLPDDLAAELERAYRELVRDDRDAPVLVSLSEPSAPGLEGPEIEAHGTGSFFRAVRRCWSAFFDPRRVLARAERGLPQVDGDVAIVVRRLRRPSPARASAASVARRDSSAR